MGMTYYLGCHACAVKLDLGKNLVGPKFYVLGPLNEPLTAALGEFMHAHRGHYLMVCADSDDALDGFADAALTPSEKHGG